APATRQTPGSSPARPYFYLPQTQCANIRTPRLCNNRAKRFWILDPFASFSSALYNFRAAGPVEGRFSQACARKLLPIPHNAEWAIIPPMEASWPLLAGLPRVPAPPRPTGPLARLPVGRQLAAARHGGMRSGARPPVAPRPAP